jgi:hypothetical protein
MAMDGDARAWLQMLGAHRQSRRAPGGVDLDDDIPARSHDRFAFGYAEVISPPRRRLGDCGVPSQRAAYRNASHRRQQITAIVIEVPHGRLLVKLAI